MSETLYSEVVSADDANLHDLIDIYVTEKISKMDVDQLVDYVHQNMVNSMIDMPRDEVISVINEFNPTLIEEANLI